MSTGIINLAAFLMAMPSQVSVGTATAVPPQVRVRTCRVNDETLADSVEKANGR